MDRSSRIRSPHFGESAALLRAAVAGICLAFAVLGSAAPARCDEPFPAQKMRWKPIPNAIAYEVEGSKSRTFNSRAFRLKSETPEIEVPLAPGLYFVRWREILEDDDIRGPTEWIGPARVVVRPGRPQLATSIHPEFRNPGEPLKWKSVPGVDWYYVIARRDGDTVFKRKVKGTAMQVPEKLSEGKYSWEVSAIKPSPFASRNPASSEPRYLMGKNSTESYFEVKSQVLPEATWPQGRQVWRETPFIFNWKPADRKCDYSVNLYELNDNEPPLQISRAQGIPGTVWRDLAGVLPTGHYAWEVICEEKDAQRSIASEKTEFKVEDHLSRLPGTGRFAAGANQMRMAYSSQAEFGSANFASNLSGFMAQGYYQLKRDWELNFHGNHSTFSFDGASAAYTTLTGGASWSKGPKQSSRWTLFYGGNLGYSSIPELIERTDATDRGTTTSISLIPNMRADYKLQTDTVLFVGAALPLPIMFSGGSQGGARTGRSYDFLYQVRGGLNGAWFWPWGVTTEATYIRDTYSYTSPEGKVSVDLSGFRFSFGIFYSF